MKRWVVARSSPTSKDGLQVLWPLEETMAVKLRLARYGSKKNAFYRIVATDERARRDGRFIEQIGTYDPNRNPAAVALHAERVRYWLNQGAQASDTVRNLLDIHLVAENA